MTTNASRVGHQNGEFVPGRFEKCRADTESPHSVPGGVKDAGHDVTRWHNEAPGRRIA